MLTAGPAVARRARERLEAGGAEAGTLLALAGGNPAAVTAEIVAKAWRDGDPLATAILEETADLLAIWLGNMIDLFDPDVIVVGGGMSELIGGGSSESASRYRNGRSTRGGAKFPSFAHSTERIPA